MAKTLPRTSGNHAPTPDLDLERTVLGACLIDADAYAKASRHLSPRDFYMESHGAVFAAMGTLAKKAEPIDNVTVATELRKHELLDRVGGSAAIVSLQAGAFTARNVESYAKRLRQESVKRRRAATAREVVRVLDDPALDLATADPLIAELATPASLNGAKPSPAQQLGPVFTAVALMMAVLPPLRWAVAGLLPEGLVILASKPKRGKSWMALGWSIAIAVGGYVLGKMPVAQGDVLFIGLEDGPGRLQSRLQTLLAGSPAPASLFLATEWPRLDEGGLERLRDWLERHPDARLIVLDTWARIRPLHKRRDDNPYERDYAEAGLLKALAQEFSVCIAVLHHHRKMQADDWLDSLNSTTGFSAAADCILGLFGTRGERVAPLKVTGRDLPETELQLAFDGTIGTWTLIGEGARLSAERQAILDLLRTAGPLTPAQVANELDKNASTCRTLLQKLRADGYVAKDGEAYSLVGDNPASPAVVGDLLADIELGARP